MTAIRISLGHEQRLGWAFLVGALAVGATLVLRGSAVTYDDGFYYLRIAQQVASGHGPTFDGLHPTSGFHALWLLILVPLAMSFPEPRFLEAAAIMIQSGLFGLALALFYSGFARRMAKSLALPATLILAVATCRFAWLGLEYSLSLCLFVLFLDHLCEREVVGSSRLNTTQLVCVSTLLVAARLDFALLVALLACWDVYCRRPTIEVVAYAAPAFAVCLGWWLFSATVGGHLLPVSGWIKRVWSGEYLLADPVYQQHGWFVSKAGQFVAPLVNVLRIGDPSLALANGLMSIGVFVGPWFPHGRFCREVEVGRLYAVAAFALLQYLFYAMLLHGGFTRMGWYYIAQPCVGILVIAMVARVWLSSQRLGGFRRTCYTGANVSLLAAGVLSIYSLVGLERGPMQGAVAWVRSNTPPDARVGAWNAGYLAFYSERQVVNLDGLVNSWEFARHSRHDLCSYWEANDLDYIVDYYDPSSTDTVHKRALAPVPVFADYEQCVDALRRVATIRDEMFADPKLEVHIHKRDR